MYKRRAYWAAAAASMGLNLAASPAGADSLFGALESTYVANHDLNAARAAVRAIDEDVPEALSGYRPTISLGADYGFQTIRSNLSPEWSKGTNPRGVSVSIEQPIFLGFQTKNSVRAAEASVKAAREQLEGVEQDVFIDAVTAFMDVVQAQAVLNLRAQNVEFLREQVRAAADRLNVGEGTRTDLAQAQGRLSLGLAEYAAAAAQLNAAIANYDRVIGHKPRSLGVANSIDRLLPRTLDAALNVALGEHPSILAASYNVDVASFNVTVIQGQLLPSAVVRGQYSHRHGESDAGGATWRDSASIVGELSVPIYDAGQTPAQVRQAKETLGQRRIELDLARSQVKQDVISAWGQLEAARAQVRATAAQVAAERLALSGVIEERRVGQRTTLDVLNAQSELVNALLLQVDAQRDRVVSAYTLLATLGRLNAESLRLNVTIYDPAHHFRQVRNKWFGLRTPDGR